MIPNKHTNACLFSGRLPCTRLGLIPVGLNSVWLIPVGLIPVGLIPVGFIPVSLLLPMRGAVPAVAGHW